MNNEDYQELETLREENENLKNQLSMIDFPNNSEQLTSEKNFALLAGKDEIPKRYKEVFEFMLTPSTQWMNIQSKEEEEYWVSMGMHAYNAFVFANPNCGFNEFDKKAIEILLRRRLNKSYGGFERLAIISNIQEINYQTTPVRPEAPKREGLLQRLNPFKK